MCVYRSFIRPILFQFDPEEIHGLAHKFISISPAILHAFSANFIYLGSDLEIPIFGTTLSNPIGLAAGFDKNGDLIHALKYLGFGYGEIGSVTGQAHRGNAKPRLWRLPADSGLINWLGLNSKGAAQVSEKLARSKFSVPLSINIAKTNKPNVTGEAAYEDMLLSFRAIRHLPLLYVAFNVSCPNTVDGILEETVMLASVIEQVKKENPANLPILLKLSPDSDDKLIQKMIEIGKEFSIAGYICGNTSMSRAALKTSGANDIKVGGISGPPLKPLALSLCRNIYKLKEKNQIVIGCGGISNGQDAYDYIRAGASLLQLYTSLVYEGPSIVRKINEELSGLLKRDKLTIVQAIGIDRAIG